MYNDIGILGINLITGGMLKYVLINVLVVIVAYALGCISPATILAKKRGIDIRKEGSGNPGTTNTLRVMGKKEALIVLLVDVLKGAIAVILAGTLIGMDAAMVAAVFVFIGHVFPVTHKFQGGKGVATAFGALTAIHPAIGFGCLGIVIVCVAISRRMSVGSIIGAIACPVLSFIIEPRFFLYALFMAVIVLLKHAGNIKRLMRGEEPKLSFKSKGKNEKIEEAPAASEEPEKDESKETKKHDKDEFDF